MTPTPKTEEKGIAADKKYRYVTIGYALEEQHGRPVYSITNNKSGTEIGLLEYYPPWRCYVFMSAPECVFNASCLRDILDFMGKVPPIPTKGEK